MDIDRRRDLFKFPTYQNQKFMNTLSLKTGRDNREIFSTERTFRNFQRSSQGKSREPRNELLPKNLIVNHQQDISNQDYKDTNHHEIDLPQSKRRSYSNEPTFVKRLVGSVRISGRNMRSINLNTRLMQPSQNNRPYTGFVKTDQSFYPNPAFPIHPRSYFCWLTSSNNSIAEKSQFVENNRNLGLAN